MLLVEEKKPFGQCLKKKTKRWVKRSKNICKINLWDCGQVTEVEIFLAIKTGPKTR